MSAHTLTLHSKIKIQVYKPETAR